MPRIKRFRNYWLIIIADEDGIKFDTLQYQPFYAIFWSNYSDLTRPHPKWWFSRGNPLISGKSRLVKYYNLARIFFFPVLRKLRNSRLPCLFDSSLTGCQHWWSTLDRGVVVFLPGNSSGTDLSWRKAVTCVPGSKLPIIGDGHQPNSRGLYTHYKDSVIKSGRFPIPNIRSWSTLAHVKVWDSEWNP